VLGCFNPILGQIWTNIGLKSHVSISRPLKVSVLFYSNDDYKYL